MLNLKKEKQLLNEIERALQQNNSQEESLEIVLKFESISFEFRNNFAAYMYNNLWPVALSAGKIGLANTYGQKALEYLIEFKRVAKLKQLISVLKEKGLCKKFIKDNELILDVLLGVKSKDKKLNLNYMQILTDHPEHWSEDTDFIKMYIQLEPSWKIDEWKYCYAFVLKKHFDVNVFYSLYEKSFEFKNEKYINLFEELFKRKKIQFVQLKTKKEPEEASQEATFNVDYDQLAFNLLSGKIEPSDDEQYRVIQSLLHLTEQDLEVKGHDMIVAFELLGMEKVVFSLCEKMIAIEKDYKKKASIYFIWTQALFNSEEYHKAIHLIENVVESQPLVEEEYVAFLYMKAEAFFKIKNYKSAHVAFKEVKKYKSNYRMVKERLKVIEEIK